MTATPDPPTSGTSGTSDFLQDAARADFRAEVAILIATARRYGVSDPFLMSDFAAVLKQAEAPVAERQALSVEAPAPHRVLRPRKPGTGDIA